MAIYHWCFRPTNYKPFFTGAPVWSPVAIWSMWIVWSMLFSPQLVEYNRISNVVRLVTNVAILLVLIEFLLPPDGQLKLFQLLASVVLIVLSILFFLTFTSNDKIFPNAIIYHCHDCTRRYGHHYLA